jgi:class 3 adenylate cyclase
MTASFRSRLLQTIVVVVVVTTAASLWIAQRQHAASYRALVDTLFREQTLAFEREQALRHRLAAENVARLADSVRLFAALEASDPEVYKIAGDELRLGEFDFFRLFDADGGLIEPPSGHRAGRLERDTRQEALLPASARATDGVQLGFIAAPGRDSAALAYRLYCAPIVQFDERVGTLVLGQRIQLAARDTVAAGPLQSAILVDGAALGGEMSAAMRDAVLAQRSDDAELALDSRRYRVQRSLLNPHSVYSPAFLVSAFSLESFDSQQRALTAQIVGIGTAALLLATLVGAALARQLAAPVARLVDATQAIRRGHFDHVVAPASTREMNTLAHAFNEMATGLAQKERYRSVLQQVADPQVAEALIAGKIRLGGELRLVTVLFCDIRGYTAFTVGRKPESVIAVLNDHLGAMTRVVQDHGGVINQFAGDSIMALFGAPQSYGDDTERAVGCAIAMMAERARRNRDAAVPIGVGIGIASGEMVAGCIGSESRSDYTVVGERVNLAARLTAAAAAGEIVIDETTRDRAGHRFTTTPLPPLALKGFAKAIVAYRVETAS